MKQIKRAAITALSVTLAGNLAVAGGGYRDANLSACENGLLEAMSDAEKKSYFETAVSIVPAGAISTGVFMSMESLEVSSAATGAAAAGTSAGMVSSAAAPGLLTVAIVAGTGYSFYRQISDNNGAVLQLFRDVRNNGMGQQIDVHTQSIKSFLIGFEKKSAAYGKSLSGETIKDENIKEELIKVVGTISDSDMITCEDGKKLSLQIDQKVVNNLVRKYNPGISVDLQLSTR